MWLKQIEMGREPPQAFHDQPDLDQGELLFLEAFRELGSERQIGMSIGPIPHSHIQRYADELGLIGDDRDHFCTTIALVDADYLGMISEKADDPKNKMRVVVTPDDTTGVRRLFKRIAKK